MTLFTQWLWIILKKRQKSVTNRESFKNFKTIIRKCVKMVLQSVTFITKRDRIYYEVWKILQSVTGITKSDNYFQVIRNKGALIREIHSSIGIIYK